MNFDPNQNIRFDGCAKLPFLSSFEKCLICRLFLHTIARQVEVGLFFNKHQTRVGQILKEWAPKWALVGDDLSLLDITADYLKKEVPDVNVELGESKMVFVDGKDSHLSPKGNNSAVLKSTYSLKTDKDAARCLTFPTASGLVFEHTRLFGGRAGERRLVEFLGQLGPLNSKVEEWEDAAINS